VHRTFSKKIVWPHVEHENSFIAISPSPSAPRGAPGSERGPATGYELQDDYHQGAKEQQVNEAGRDVERDETHGPQNEKHDGDSPKHGGILFSNRGALSGRLSRSVSTLRASAAMDRRPSISPECSRFAFEAPVAVRHLCKAARATARTTGAGQGR
jgi:hypothetical protein